jgi:NAD(P)-dependent dehydrogenase (short-subunit alcohol dehydrogenase family)
MAGDVIVVTGAGGIGLAIASRLAPGRTTLLADFTESTMADAAARLSEAGHDVHARRTDVGDPASVAELAEAAAALGPVRHLVHTAGVAPGAALTPAILRTNLLGTALMLDAFEPVIAPGGAGVVIASLSGHLYPALSAAEERQLATVPPAELLTLPCASPDGLNAISAYGFAKRANQLRVRAAAVSWGRRGARLNSISPGVIATPMTRPAMADETAPMHAMIASTPAARIGTPGDIAAAAAFLLGPDATFITGTDLAVDGGAHAATWLTAMP